MSPDTKWVYLFDEGEAGMKELLGGKGANLAEMTRLGLPIPPGFVITTEACNYHDSHGGEMPSGLQGQVDDALVSMEKAMGAGFGNTHRPLLLSVRSGARVSMPGMMDTVLNLGLNDETVEGLAAYGGDPRFAWDCYRRLVQMYGDVVLGLQPADKKARDPFEPIIEDLKRRHGVVLDTGLTAEHLMELVGLFKKAILDGTGREFPPDVREQLWGAVGAVFSSWGNERAITYRNLNGIPHDWGTAVNVQCMVFGNLDDESGTGVGFTRDPATGEKVFYGEYLMNAQGEDVVAGVRTPLTISQMKGERPVIYSELEDICGGLEEHYKDMQDLEFTIERAKLWILQTRAGKRTGHAAVRIAVDMVEEGLISREEAVMRVEPDQLNQLLGPVFDPDEKDRAIKEGRLLAKGLSAGPGAAAGRIVFCADDAVAWAAQGHAVLLVRVETSPEDIKGMNAAEGILTQRGGMTSHAALVARQMGKVCVAGCSDIRVDYAAGTLTVADNTYEQGEWLSLDGTEGQVIEGQLSTRPSEIVQVLVEGTLAPEDSMAYGYFSALMGYADSIRRLGVRTNADQPDQAQTAVKFGAEGIGLCRTEHMFFGGDRIDAVREMILASTPQEQGAALDRLLPYQTEDFKGLFRAMAGKPVTIRTLDPPLHEFLPHTPEEIAELAGKMGVDTDRLAGVVASLKEANPMLGHRGCRLGVTNPEITLMQARAIIEAACAVKKEGIDVHPEIMIPLVGHVNELRNQEALVRKAAREVMAREGVEVDYLVGTMIELPRAALTADEVARCAEFFSFGTNDLTQTTFGLSRDDSGPFLAYYQDNGILEADPFQAIDREGIGALMRIGVEKGRCTRPDLKVGICGEHGGEPSSVEFCHAIGLDYVSCSPYRVPIAKLAAAQAVLKERKGGLDAGGDVCENPPSGTLGRLW